MKRSERRQNDHVERKRGRRNGGKTERGRSDDGMKDKIGNLDGKEFEERIVT